MKYIWRVGSRRRLRRFLQISVQLNFFLSTGIRRSPLESVFFGEVLLGLDPSHAPRP
jgi:hypothetical protein